MKFKNTILAVIFLQLMSCILCSSAYAVYPGTFNFNSESAFIMDEIARGGSFIRYVNFKDEIEKIIKYSFILSHPAINYERKILVFFDKNEVVFYNIKNEKIFFTVPVKSGSKITWDCSGNKISYYDLSAKMIMEIDIDRKKIIKIPFVGSIIKTKWDKKSNSFLYQLLNYSLDNKVAYLDAKIMENVNGALQEHKGVKTLTTSPDNKYYYERVFYPQEDNSLSFYKVDGDRLIASYRSMAPFFNTDVIWGIDTARFLSVGGVFDLKTGRLITFTHNYREEKGVYPEKVSSRQDVAADWNNYVLIWNREKNIFEVEDINTGKIIKTYKKFW